MRARTDDMEQALELYAEVYHQSKIASLKEEGERLRRELRLRGIDPGLVLVQAGLACRGRMDRTEQLQ